ncbi:MAG: hypothetical protein IKY94_15800 [Lachnospiraceae bacterium]|nr:hypothetical protein [Lachnospiraceae bacterium]
MLVNYNLAPSEHLQTNIKMYIGMTEHLLEANLLGFANKEIVFLGCQGSQNYNLDTPKSDLDTKLLTLPSFANLAMNKAPLSTTHILKNNEHMDLKDIRLFIPTLRKQNVNFVEMLFTDYYFINDLYAEEWNKLIKAREEIARYSPNDTIKAMRGIAYNKYKVFNNKVSEGMREDLGYDPKQVYQLGRVVEFLERYMEGKETYAELLKTKQRDKLLSLKRGDLTLTEAEEYMNTELTRVEALTIDYLATWRPINMDVYKLLDEVQYNIMKIYMQEVVKYV